MRAAANGDLLLHPVLRSLYRTEMHRTSMLPTKDFHRFLAEYYYAIATEPQT